MGQEIIIPQKLNSEVELAAFLNKNYMNQIKNFFGNEEKAMKFLSSMRADIQRNPKLMQCTPTSLINSYIMMAQMGFMPSGISGEAYVLPYQNSKKVGNTWEKVMEAQLQVGYQGLVTLYYSAGVEKIISGIVRKNDKTSFINGDLTHEVDLSLSSEERGEAIGAYVTAIFRGEKMTKYMNGKDIIAHAAKYSKSYDPVGKFSPWNPENDREKWMWMKTVIKQHKLLPKNENINRALDLDNKDSRISDIKGRIENGELTMGKFLDMPNHEKTSSQEEGKPQGNQEEGADDQGFADSNEVQID